MEQEQCHNSTEAWSSQQCQCVFVYVSVVQSQCPLWLWILDFKTQSLMEYVAIFLFLQLFANKHCHLGESWFQTPGVQCECFLTINMSFQMQLNVKWLQHLGSVIVDCIYRLDKCIHCTAFQYATCLDSSFLPTSTPILLMQLNKTIDVHRILMTILLCQWNAYLLNYLFLAYIV